MRGKDYLMTNDRYERGLKNAAAISGDVVQKAKAKLAEFSPDFERYFIEYPFGDIYNRPGLDLKSREFAALAALTVLGAAAQLEMHIGMALHVGCSREEIIEVFIQMSVFAGFPAALNALAVAQKVFERVDGARPEG